MSTCKHDNSIGRLGLESRAVAATGWRWMPGMLLTNGCRVVSVDGNRLSACSVDGDTTRVLHEVAGWQHRPDFTDSVTLIALEHLGRSNQAKIPSSCCNLDSLVTALESTK